MVFQKLIVFLSALMLLGGCASRPPSESLLSGKASAAALQLDIAPGMFESWKTAFTLDEPVNMDVSFIRLRPSKEWSSLLNICLHDDSGSVERVCLRIYASPDKAIPAEIQLLDWPDGKSARRIPSVDQVPVFLAMEDSVRISIAKADAGVAFSANGALLFQYPLAKPFRAMSLSCSSATCKFTGIQ